MGAFFSIIMPSYLGSYPHAARNREVKIFRAIDSIFQQTDQEFEIVFVSDGCRKGYEMVDQRYADSRMRPYMIPKQDYLSGVPRNFGISKAQGKYIVYLDIDDAWGAEHLERIRVGLKAGKQAENGSEIYHKWAFFDDWIGSKNGEFRRRHCDHRRRHECGTSNIAHRRDSGVWWGQGYLHDWHFIQELRKAAGEPKVIAPPEYFVCHVPRVVDI